MQFDYKIFFNLKACLITVHFSSGIFRQFRVYAKLWRNWEQVVKNNLVSILKKKKTTIVKGWFEVVVSTYAPDTATFLKSQKDQFANPVGQTTLKGLEAVFDEIVSGMDRKAIISFLDPIIRIRAIQDFTPAQAVAFILDLKKVVREKLKKELKTIETSVGLADIDANIDQLCLIGFDIYVGCRQAIYQLKVDTERKKIYSAFSRAGLVTEIPEDGPGFQTPKS